MNSSNLDNFVMRATATISFVAGNYIFGSSQFHYCYRLIDNLTKKQSIVGFDLTTDRAC
jgi:hypothetical protein